MGTTTDITSSGSHKTASAVRIEDPVLTGTSGYQQGIAEFLEKPLLVTTITWAADSPQDTVLWSGDILPILKSNPIWMNKVSGAGSLRATAVITIQVNPAPQNAGGLILHFIPNYSHVTSFHAGRTALIQKTQQPHIKMDIANDKEITMDIPYVAPTTFINLGTDLYDWGRAFLTVMSPFTSGTGSPNSCSISIWLSFKDLELANPVIAQARGGIKVGQRGTIRAFDKPHPSEQEKGPVSKVLSAVSIMAGTLSTIPTLATIAGPVSWFTNVAAGVATSFGWSKPINDDTGGRVTVGPHWGMNNCNGVDQSQALSMFADNKVRVMTHLGGDDQDQMSINFLKSVPTFFGNIELTTGDLPNTIKLSQKLGPRSISQTFPFSAGGVSYTGGRMSPLCYLSYLFRNFRGGMCVRFHAYKTQFHTGRLLIAFSPPGQPTPTLAQTAYLHRAIVDLSEGNEFCLNFPYTATADYISSGAEIGFFHVFVLNPLRGPDNVASKIQITLEAWGAPDLEFQIPSTGNHRPIHAQAGGDDTDDIICEDIGGSVVPTEIVGASQYCVGEHATSLLQLLKRYYHYRFRYENEFKTGNGTMKIHPFHNGSATYGTVGITDPDMGMDMLAIVSSFYVFARGGVRFRIANAGVNGFWSTWLESPRSTTVSTFLTTETIKTKTQTLSPPFVQPCSAGGFSVQVPQYSRNYCRLNHYMPDAGASYPPDAPDVALTIQLNGITSTAEAPKQVNIFRAAADDFQLSYFIGIPDIWPL